MILHKNEVSTLGYIQKSLLADESMLFQTKRHWVIFILPIIFTILGFVFSEQKSLLIMLGYLCFIIAIVQWVTSLILYFTSEYGLTNKRVLVKEGFIKRHSLETLLQRIAVTKVEQSLLGRILGYGNIVIHSTGGDKEILKMINKPLLFRRKVQEQIEKSA